MGQLHRLIYASRSTMPVAEFDEQLRGLLITSIVNNRKVDVTGLLLIHGDWFVQALEGPERNVRETFERISRDPRHAEINILSDAAAERRAFRDWNMCARRLVPADIALMHGLGQASFNPHDLTAEQAFGLLSGVGRVHAA